MKMNYLGNTGIKVSELCFGTMTFGGKQHWANVGSVMQNDATLMADMAMESGINFFDTADVYSEGLAEELLGKALGSKRNQVVVATKVRGRTGKGCNDVGLTRHHIIEGCHASLKRLGTDYIDLYQVHSVDPATPQEETLRALDDLVHAGKVRYLGASNYTGWQLMKALAISERLNLEKFVTLQAQYSLVTRDIENELVPLCLDQKLGILTWSPLSGGFLSGKYQRGKPRPVDARLTDPDNQFLQIDEDKAFGMIDELKFIADDHRATIAQSALNYLLRKPGVCSVIIGARNIKQLADNLKTANWTMTADEVKRLDALSVPPRVYPNSMLERTSLDR